jgi:hypothetical protein
MVSSIRILFILQSLFQRTHFSPEAIIQIHSAGEPQVNKRVKTVGLTQSEILSSFQTLHQSRSYS